MTSTYSHLSQDDRACLRRARLQGHSLRDIASQLDRSPSTVSRELRRNAQGAGYDAIDATRAARQRRRRGPRKLRPDSVLSGRVVDGLMSGWSPLQIAGRLARMDDAPAIGTVCPETIYRTIYALPRGELRKQLIAYLRCAHRQRMPRARGAKRAPGFLIGASSIHERPQDVLGRQVPGHWEGDLIKGAGNRSAVGTLLERKSRYLLLVRLDDASAESVLAGFTRRFRHVPACVRKSLTYDQGSEMARHADLAQRVNINICFCDPHSPGQRASNENANGLVREYLPKGIDLSGVSQTCLNDIAPSLNNRPRKVLDFLTPAEVFQRDILNSRDGVALQI